MQEKLIEFETAILAKDNGFDLECKNYYDTNKSNKLFDFYGKLNANDFKHFKEIDGDYGSFNAGYVSAPTQSLLQKWLREEHDIHLQIVMHSWMDRTYCFKLHWKDAYVDSSKLLYPGPIIGEYEDVLEKGLIEALNKVKFKK